MSKNLIIISILLNFISTGLYKKKKKTQEKNKRYSSIRSRCKWFDSILLVFVIILLFCLTEMHFYAYIFKWSSLNNVVVVVIIVLIVRQKNNWQWNNRINFLCFTFFFWLRRRRRSLLHTLLTTHQPNISFFTSHVFTLLHKMQKNNHCSKSTKVIVYCIPFMSAKDEDLCELYLPVIVIVFLVFVSIAILIFYFVNWSPLLLLLP